jgi:hypothetical protein
MAIWAEGMEEGLDLAEISRRVAEEKHRRGTEQPNPDGKLEFHSWRDHVYLIPAMRTEEDHVARFQRLSPELRESFLWNRNYIHRWVSRFLDLLRVPVGAA